MINMVRERMAANSRGDLPGHYWYPLAMASYDAEEVMAVIDTLTSYRTTMAEITRQFEDAFAARQGSAEAVMVNSGSSADLLTAFALVNPSYGMLAPGDEILAPSVTWPTQIWALMMAGLTVKLVDTDPTTLNMDLTALRAAVTDQTRAISLVHLMGNPVDLHAVNQLCDDNDLCLIEDCCEALDARYHARKVGGFGVAGTFSFFFSHHMTTLEGGMIVTDDLELAEMLRLLRAHGWSRNLQHPTPVDGLDPRYTFQNWGFNVRPMELQAAFGLVQLERLAGFQTARRHNYDRLASQLPEGVTVPVVPAGAHPAPFAVPLLVDDRLSRDGLVKHLEAAGVETRAVVAGNIVRHPAAWVHGLMGHYPGADRVHTHGLYVGLRHTDDSDGVDRVAGLIGEYVEAAA